MRRLWVVPLLASIGACRCESERDAVEAAAEAAPSASASEGVTPVSPDVPPSAVARKFCIVIHLTEARRRRECCNTLDAGMIDVGVATQCTSDVTTALEHGSITLAPADVQACAAAMERSFSGCDWVGPAPAAVPRECQGILHGTLADGATCSSALECVSGLTCRGGKCAPVAKNGERCGRGGDALATSARQDICGTSAKSADAASLPKRKASGEPCKKDSECAGACIAGTCGKKCP